MFTEGFGTFVVRVDWFSRIASGVLPVAAGSRSGRSDCRCRALPVLTVSRPRRLRTAGLGWVPCGRGLGPESPIASLRIVGRGGVWPN